MTAQAVAAAPPDQILSVAEIQQAFRSLTAARTGVHRTADEMAKVQAAPASHALLRDWIAVVAAHSGAGASSVALAITDALTERGERARLVETASPTRSGLVAAAANELGMDSSGDWRRGSRGTAIVLRRASDASPGSWPEDKPDTRTVVDLGLPAPNNVARLADERPRLVVVCRATIPAARLAEHMLSHFDESISLVVAAVGQARWPGAVEASLGPHLARLRTEGRVVSVPFDRNLSITGPSHLPLPKRVVSAADELLHLISAASDNAGRSLRLHRRKGIAR